MFFLLLEPPCLLLSFSNCCTPLAFSQNSGILEIGIPIRFGPSFLELLQFLLWYLFPLSLLQFLLWHLFPFLLLQLFFWYFFPLYLDYFLFTVTIPSLKNLAGFLSLKFFIRMNPFRDRITSPDRNIFLGSNFFVVYRIREYLSSKGNSSPDILSFFAHTKWIMFGQEVGSTKKSSEVHRSFL